jgi:hypothetical protein
VHLGERACERVIAGGVRTGAEVHIERDDRRPRGIKAREELRMISPGPRPGVDFREALGVNLDDCHLAARRSVSLLQLRRLTTDEVSTVAAGCLGGLPVPAALVDALVPRADGLPFLVEELLAAMVQAGELQKTPEGWTLDRSFSVAVPVTFAETVRRRIAAAPGIRGLLGAAAVLGRSFDWRLLPDMIKGDLPEGEKRRRWRHLEDADLAQMLYHYPPGYLSENCAANRIIETVERFEEDLTGKVRVHGPIEATVTVGDAVEVSTARETRGESDPLMTAIESQLRTMLGITAE